jgi:WD40 repeat protein
MAFSPDGKILAVGGGDSGTDAGIVTLWDAQTHQGLGAIRAHEGVGVSVTSLAFSPTDNHILAVGGTDKTVELWDLRHLDQPITLPLEAHKFPVTSVAFSPDGKTIASGDSGGIVNVWSASTYQWMLELKASSASIQSIAFTANGQSLFTDDVKGEIREWRAAPREPGAASARLTKEEATPNYLAWLLSGSRRTDGTRRLGMLQFGVR